MALAIRINGRYGRDVAHVLLRRDEDFHFGHTICGICFMWEDVSYASYRRVVGGLVDEPVDCMTCLVRQGNP